MGKSVTRRHHHQNESSPRNVFHEGGAQRGRGWGQPFRAATPIRYKFVSFESSASCYLPVCVQRARAGLSVSVIK